MKQHLARTSFGIILSVALAGMVPTLAAHSCSLARVAGKYGFTSSGTIVTSPVGPFTAVGHVTFSEAGTFSGAQTTKSQEISLTRSFPEHST